MFSSKTIRCLKLEGLIAVCSLLHKIPFKHEFSKAITELVKISRNFTKILEKKSLYYRPFLTYKLGGILVPRALLARGATRGSGQIHNHPRPQAQARAALTVALGQAQVRLLSS
jgi:hypothetical protein